MRRFAILFALTLASVFIIASPTPAAHLSDGLVGYWPFDDGADPTEEVAHGYDADLHGATFTGTGPNLPGNDDALEFTGDDFVSVAHASELDMTAAYSFSAWLNRGGENTEYRPIFVRGAGDVDDIEVYVQWSTLDLVVAHNRGNGGTFDYVAFEDPPGTLFHLAVTYDGTDVKVYYNGSPAAVTQESTAMTAPLDSNAGWMFGKVEHADFSGDGEGVPDYFSGYMDEVRFYDEALSVAKVEALADYSEFEITSLGPDGEFNKVGTDHTTTVDISPNLSFIPVSFALTGSSANAPLDELKMTDGSGGASMTYQGDVAGVDTIEACVDVGTAECGDEGDGFDSVEKYWYEIYTKFSGTAGGDTSLTPGKSQKWSFSGYAGYVPGYGAFGEVTVNYRELGETCTFTPGTSGTFILRDASVTATADNDEAADMNYWENSCGGTAWINVLDDDANAAWSRGAVWVDASDDDYDVKAATADQWVKLVTGNAHTYNLS